MPHVARPVATTDVVAGAERVAGALDDEDLDVGRRVDEIDRPDQLVAERDRQRVALLGPVECDPRDRAILDVAQEREAGSVAGLGISHAAVVPLSN